METKLAIEMLAALAQPTRLALFRHLVGALPAGLAAGDLARQLQVPPSTLSAHLSQLAGCGLVQGEVAGRHRIYRPSLAAMQELVAFLLADCCQGQPDACQDMLDAVMPAASRAKTRAESA